MFVPFVLSGEIVDATLTEDKPGFARAALNRVLEPSSFRIQPGCPYYMRCGGCQYQHASYQHQLEIKVSILKENLRRIAKLDLATDLQIHPSPPWNYRNRTRMRVQAEPFLVGYNRFNSHELEPVEQCPISSTLINNGIAALWKIGHEGGIQPGIREVEFFATANDSELLLEVYAEAGISKGQAQTLCERLRSDIANTAGVVAFAQARDASKPGNRVLGSVGTGALEYATTEDKYRVSAGAFFQTNRYLTDELVRIVTARQSGRTALDLYAGVGLFAAVLSRRFERVIAVESSPQSAADLEYNLPGNAKSVCASVEQYLAKKAARADLVVVDPPRGGLGHKITAGLAKLRTPNLIYVSCDPATLARDLVPLLAGGYRVEQAHLVDLFPQTFHIESVLHLSLH